MPLVATDHDAVPVAVRNTCEALEKAPLESAVRYLFVPDSLIDTCTDATPAPPLSEAEPAIAAGTVAALKKIPSDAGVVTAAVGAAVSNVKLELAAVFVVLPTLSVVCTTTV